MLEASDADTVADYVTFNITVPPRAGEIQKRRAWERVGWAVNSFQQLDLYKVHYHVTTTFYFKSIILTTICALSSYYRASMHDTLLISI